MTTPELPLTRTIWLQIVTELREIFCGPIGTEYYHLRNRDAAFWIREGLAKYKVLQMVRDVSA